MTPAPFARALAVLVIAAALAGGLYALRTTAESPDQAANHLSASLTKLYAAEHPDAPGLNGRSFLDASKRDRP